MNRRQRLIGRAAADDAAAAVAAAAPGAALVADDDIHRLQRFGFYQEHVPEDAVEHSWENAIHRHYYIRELTEDDPRAETPAEFRGELYLPQKTMLAAMDYLENSASLRTSQGMLQLSMARIAAQFSFGKTVLALARVCAQRVPRARPSLAPLITGNLCNQDGYFMPEVSVRYSQVFPLTIVAAAANVISQWEENAARFTNLRVLIIENVHSLRAFETLYRNGKAVSDYDIIFVKAGRVVSTFTVAGELGDTPAPAKVGGVPAGAKVGGVPAGAKVGGVPAPVKAGDVPAPANMGDTPEPVLAGEALEELNDGAAIPKPPSKSTRSIISAIGKILEGVPVARLIIDDYDTLKLSSDDCFIPALFTWLISATRRRTTSTVAYHPGKSIVDYFRQNMCTGIPVLGAALDETLNSCGSLRCAANYVDSHINSTICSFRRINVAGGRVAGILRDLDVPDDVFEMVNADAVGTAAAALGLEATSVGDIIRRVVGGHLEKLRMAARSLSRVTWLRANLHNEDKKGLGTDNQDMAPLKKALKDFPDASFLKAWTEFPKIHPGQLEHVLADASAHANEAIEKYGKTLGRMRDNIREGCCQVCTVPFQEDESEQGSENMTNPDEYAAYVLAGCCQIIICENCVTKKVGGTRQFISRCPNCAVDININTGLIRVGAELDLEAALNDDALAQQDSPSALADSPSAPADAASAPADAANTLDVPFMNPKLRALVQFIKNEPVESIHNEMVPAFIHGLLDGVRNAPWPADKPRKFLIFTMHSEATRHIEFALEIAQVSYGVLRGTRTQKDAAVEKLRTAAMTSVLLVTAAKDCAGIHMPWLSHVVFYHRVADHHVEAQVAARGQRLGREYNLEVVLIANEAEI